ncbi:uncharacterized protein LOC107266601 [Cephus cinctus]|uniref:Phospholipase A2 n=1 Tax=Cephus cinctus TaxID=211228 RepID=A0AAJ7FHZ6_CEPCN|nr:uncharacterized protein LOC107266601 [Cephus cinctus]XP_024939673.1 uncharacterized protein LOC107266601 [Cephus cinctus]
MTSFEVTLFFVLCASSFSLQQPTFFKSTYKGLNRINPRAALSTSGEMLAVYYHDQTVAVVELGMNNELHNCELVEVYEPHEAIEVLKNLSSEVQPQQVSFQEMMKLMRQCDILDKMQGENSHTLSTIPKGNGDGINPLSLLSGIIPGTKWCGTGDIAENYHDLGEEASIDRCCRSHDLCPVKVRAQRMRYNLTNYSLYTKSHCNCDDLLYKCLKAASHPSGNVMGRIYFNLVKVPCIEDEGTKKRFTSVKMYY